jgi:hypothetical protein
MRNDMLHIFVEREKRNVLTMLKKMLTPLEDHGHGQNIVENPTSTIEATHMNTKYWSHGWMHRQSIK